MWPLKRRTTWMNLHDKGLDGICPWEWKVPSKGVRGEYNWACHIESYLDKQGAILEHRKLEHGCRYEAYYYEGGYIAISIDPLFETASVRVETGHPMFTKIEQECKNLYMQGPDYSETEDEFRGRIAAAKARGLRNILT